MQIACIFPPGLQKSVSERLHAVRKSPPVTVLNFNMGSDRHSVDLLRKTCEKLKVFATVYTKHLHPIGLSIKVLLSIQVMPVS